jgi:hypothetical protein
VVIVEVELEVGAPGFVSNHCFGGEDSAGCSRLGICFFILEGTQRQNSCVLHCKMHNNMYKQLSRFMLFRTHNGILSPSFLI